MRRQQQQQKSSKKLMRVLANLQNKIVVTLQHDGQKRPKKKTEKAVQHS